MLARTWYAMYSGAAPVLISLRLVSGFFTMERATRRPMRPKPLIPVSTAIDSLVEDAEALEVTAAPLNALGATKAEHDPARARVAAALSTGAIFTISEGLEKMIKVEDSGLSAGGARKRPQNARSQSRGNCHLNFPNVPGHAERLHNQTSRKKKRRCSDLVRTFERIYIFRDLHAHGEIFMQT